MKVRRDRSTGEFIGQGRSVNASDRRDIGERIKLGLKDRTRIKRLIREQQSVTADTALHLGKVIGTSLQFWINLQTGRDLSKAAIAAREELAAIRPLGQA